jgi:hypothetical protein
LPGAKFLFANLKALLWAADKTSILMGRQTLPQTFLQTILCGIWPTLPISRQTTCYTGKIGCFLDESSATNVKSLQQWPLMCFAINTF